MENIKFEAAVRAATASITRLELAEEAAKGRTHGESYRLVVHDAHNDEIILGYIAVAIFFGSEKSIDRFLELVRGASNVIRDQEGEIEADLGDGC